MFTDLTLMTSERSDALLLLFDFLLLCIPPRNPDYHPNPNRQLRCVLGPGLSGPAAAGFLGAKRLGGGASVGAGDYDSDQDYD